MGMSYPNIEQVQASTSVEQVLRWNRFLPSPRNDTQVEIINAVVERLDILRNADHDAFVRASKNIGWER